MNEQKMVIFITGLPGAGKTTIARALHGRLLEIIGDNPHDKIKMIDGDLVRERFGGDLGFSRPDREENIRRIGQLAKEAVDEGCVAVCSAIAPYEGIRKEVRSNMEEDGTSYFEVYISTPVSVCRRRDPKGLYRKADTGEITGMTGVDDPYEEPRNPDVSINTDGKEVEECINEIMKFVNC